MFTAEQVKAIVDAAIRKAEAALPARWEKAGLEIVRLSFDSSPFLAAAFAEELNKFLDAGAASASV